MHIVDEIINKYQTNNDLYIGEKVTISEHMIQTAMLAEQNHSSKSLVCSSLLHDYGHFIIENPDLLVSKSLDGKHEDLAYNFLRDYLNQRSLNPSNYTFRQKDIFAEINHIVIFYPRLPKLA